MVQSLLGCRLGCRKQILARLHSRSCRLQIPIFDRGITIPNMIAFYYGRNPKTMQADTVLQHSRMYGARDRRDLAVTRFHKRDIVDNRASLQPTDREGRPLGSFGALVEQLSAMPLDVVISILRATYAERSQKRQQVSR